MPSLDSHAPRGKPGDHGTAAGGDLASQRDHRGTGFPSYDRQRVDDPVIIGVAAIAGAAAAVRRDLVGRNTGHESYPLKRARPRWIALQYSQIPRYENRSIKQEWSKIIFDHS
jgi:hypothetical protein